MSDLSQPALSAIELRVVGALIEKSRTTPEYYPMSINALTAACNQKSARHPVTAYSEEEITQAVQSLKGRSLVATAVGGGSRTIKYKHNFGTVYDISDGGLAAICLLMLRGPLTAGEINSNSARLYNFRDLGEVLSTLEVLRSGEAPFIKELPKKAGQKENRFVHLMGDGSGLEYEEENVVEELNKKSALEERVSKLEEELEHIKSILKDLM
jgi:uncharacterized protein YceH (UPF0502 family)